MWRGPRSSADNLMKNRYRTHLPLMLPPRSSQFLLQPTACEGNSIKRLLRSSFWRILSPLQTVCYTAHHTVSSLLQSSRRAAEAVAAAEAGHKILRHLRPFCTRITIKHHPLLEGRYRRPAHPWWVDGYDGHWGTSSVSVYL